MKLFYENDSARFLFRTYQSLSFPAHMHSGLELFMVEDGEIEVTIAGQTTTLHQGDISLAFPNQIHSYETISTHSPNHGVLILCPAEISGDYLSTLLSSHPVNPFITKKQLHPDITYALKSILKTPPDNPDHIPLIRAYIHLILAHIIPKLVLKKNRDMPSPDLAAELIIFLSEHYTEPVTLNTLSKELGVSKYSVSRIFSEKLNISFSNYLNTLRIDYAKQLLQGSNHNILTISLMCGYDNIRTFNREFKALCGCQPREYRKTSLSFQL